MCAVNIKSLLAAFKNGAENILRRDCYTVLLIRLEVGRAVIADIPICREFV